MERADDHLEERYLSKPDNVNVAMRGTLRLLRVVKLRASATTLFGYLTDHGRICDFVPGMLGVTVDNGAAVVSGGQGCVRYCDFGNDMIVAEEIAIWRPPEAFAFVIASPNPFGLYNHLSSITIEEVGGESRLTWRQYYDHADLPTMNAFMAEMLDGVHGGQAFKQYLRQAGCVE